jgi:hypothetical protein
MIKQTANYNIIRHDKRGMSLVEVMVGLVLFFLVFGATFKAFAPTATDSHNLLRGVTIAMNAGNWYLNELERKINYEGALDIDLMGSNDVTYMFTEDYFSDIALLRALAATSNIEMDGNVYKVKIDFRWGNHINDAKRNHNFTLSRLIVQPSF